MKQKSKSEIFNSHKTIIDGREVLTYGNAIKAMEELENQFCQADVSGQSEQLCRIFFPDGKTTSATKCQFCGKEKWEH